VKKLKFVLSIPGDTMYLRAQTSAAQSAADRLGVELEVVSAQMDAVAQGQHLVDLVHSRTSRPAGILVEPVSAAGLPRVAEAAVAAGVGWVVSNAYVDYVGPLRKNSKAPIFQVSQDHVEVGRIQGRQIGAILPKGGSVLYLRGPQMSWWATKRFEGMESAKPKNVDARSLKVLSSTGDGAQNAVSSWLNLTRQSSHKTPTSSPEPERRSRRLPLDPTERNGWRCRARALELLTGASRWWTRALCVPQW
jgi:ribose transport system substrate-binding protein